MPPPLPRGLDADLARKRLDEEGPNELGLSQRRTLRDILLDVLREPMFLLLLGAGAIYFAMGDSHEALILLAFVFIIMGMTAFQERRSDNALAALRDLSSPRALVIRSGEARRIAGRDVVRDDVLILAEGDRIPADGLLLDAHELATNESMLTGESESVMKNSSDKVYAGTLVIAGQGVVQVTATAHHTEMGRIGKSLESIAITPSPLREEMNRLTRRLATLGIALSCGLVLLFWLMRGGWLDALLAGIALAMSLLPQEFAVIMIIFMAMAARRLAAQKVLTRRLNSIETLGETSVLCVDKTGTLTENRMRVAALCTDNRAIDVGQALPTALRIPLPDTHLELLEYAVLASEIAPHDPMEQAFHHMAGAHLSDTNRLHPDWHLAREYELSPQLLAMTHLWQSGYGLHDIVAAKGAPEAVAELCALSDVLRDEIAAQAAAMADRGLRVLGVAKALHLCEHPWPEQQQAFDFEWLGLIALADPLRDEVPNAVAQCLRAGIRVVMITGDHPRTAQAIARQAGIQSKGIITGSEILTMCPDEFADRAATINVFARIRPEQKLALVEALKAQGHVVAMTGDGVNDAPALKAAHIGIAMGQRGTDVAREAASLVLLKDDFDSIVQAIRMGRRTFANMRQAMIYTLAVHIPIAGLALLPVLFGLPLILAPLHIAFLELVIDPACSIVFEAEEADADLMNRPPRRGDEALLSSQHIGRSVAYGSVTTAVIFVIYAWLLSHEVAVAAAATAAFVILVTANAALILPSRSARPEWQRLWYQLTPTSLWVLSMTLLALAAITSIPVLAEPFRFASMSVQAWLGSFLVGLFLLPCFQVIKKIGMRVARE
ncbi:MAG: cation-translocating P-type ATPase [Oxalobacteraceae bacterium]|nr:cation-translocating P-type ATPase [Oxalobacteraceae bacterium]